MRARYHGWMPVVLAAGVVLAGPGIRDNLLRAFWIVLGLAAALLCHVLTRPRAAK